MRFVSSYFFCLALGAVGLAAPTLSQSATGVSDLKYTHLAGSDSAAEPADAPLVLQFWASWCQSCSGVTRDLAALLARESHARHLAISIDETQEAARTRSDRLAELSNSRVEVVHDSEGSWAKRFGVETVPTIIVLDRIGKELGRFVGHPNSDDMTNIALILSMDAKANSERKLP